MSKLTIPFITAFAQVSLVAVNTFQISHEMYGGTFVVSFLISLIWTINVKRVSVGSWPERLAYSSGAAVGGLAGLLIAKFILVLL